MLNRCSSVEEVSEFNILKEVCLCDLVHLVVLF